MSEAAADQTVAQPRKDRSLLWWVLSLPLGVYAIKYNSEWLLRSLHLQPGIGQTGIDPRPFGIEHAECEATEAIGDDLHALKVEQLQRGIASLEARNHELRAALRGAQSPKPA